MPRYKFPSDTNLSNFLADLDELEIQYHSDGTTVEVEGDVEVVEYLAEINAGHMED